MTINRDNYEMYFLMYVDNELSAAERKDVELFVSGNDDLKNEFELLQGTALPAEEMIFIPKTLLYKNATEVENVQESLLLHLDNELSASDAATVAAQLHSNEQVKEEWDILQKTKLDANDTITFGDKRSLYRHTDNVIAIRFRRIAVAAILLGAGIFTGISLYNKEVPDNNVATNVITGNKNDAPVVLPSTVKKDQQVKEETAVITPKENLTAQPGVTAANNSNAKNSIADKNVVVKKGNTIPAPFLNNINKDERNQTAQQNVQQKEDRITADKMIQKVNEPKAVSPEDMAVVPPSKIKEVTRPVIDTDISDVKENFARLTVNNEEESNDRILYMNEDKVSRSKLGGLFRRVKRVVERNTKIKTSNGLRIGGFEFAVK